MEQSGLREVDGKRPWLGNLTGCIYSDTGGSDDALYDLLAPQLRTKVRPYDARGNTGTIIRELA